MRTLLGTLSHLALILMVPVSGYAQQGTVTGEVRTHSSGEPVDGAVIAVQDTELRATTSKDGKFRVEEVPAGTRIVQARLEGYKVRGRSVSVPIGGTAQVQFKLEATTSSSPVGSGSLGRKGRDSEVVSDQPSCAAVTIPDGWVATDSGSEGKAHQLRGQTYRVRTYLAPVFEDGAEMLDNKNGTLAKIPTRAPGPSQLQDDTPISSKKELLAVMGHVMNTDAPVSRGGRFLSVDHPVEWGERADKWRTVRQDAFDPEDGKIASALLLGGKLLGAVGVSMAIGDLSGFSMVSATDFAIDLGSTTLNYFESITATPKDKSLAPAMRALADLDGEHQGARYREMLEKVQAREYLNRYMDISSDAAEIAGALKFATGEWSDVSTAIQNYQAAQEPIIAGTPMGETAIRNAYHFFGAAAVGAADEVATGRLLGSVENLSSGVNRYLFTANFYLTVLEAYARLLGERKQKVARPETFDSWSAYSEALSRYQYRVALYHEVRLGLMTNLHQYSKRLNDMGYKGDAAIPDETIERYRGLMNEQRETHGAIVEEISTQMQVLGAVEEGYPDFAGQDCLTDDSTGPSGDKDTGGEDPPVADGGEDPTSGDEGDTTDDVDRGDTSSAGEQELNVVYEENFSSDPEYRRTTSQSAGGKMEVYWDDARGSYYAKVRDQSSENWWALGRSPEFSTVSSDKAFTVSFKINPVEPDWGHYPGIYFVSSRRSPDPRNLDTSFKFDIKWSDNYLKKFAITNSDGDRYSTPTIPEEDEWYDVTIKYDPRSETTGLSILREDGSMFVDETDISVPIYSRFDQLAIGETQGDGVQYGDQAQVRLDDIVISSYLRNDSKGPSDGENAVDEDPPSGGITLKTRGQKVLARSSEDVKWHFATKRPEPSVSKRDGGVAYVVDGKGYRAEASHVYALEVTTGDLLWKREIGGYTKAGVLRVSDETLFVEHSSGMYALNAETGNALWVYDSFDDETTSFTFAEGTLLFLDGMPTSAHEMMGSRSQSTLHAVDLETGQGRWSMTLLSKPQKRPTSHVGYSVEGEVVTAKNTRTGRTYRLDLMTGETLEASGSSRCAATQAEKVADEAFGAWGPTEDSPEVTVDLNGDGAEEKFYQMSGTNRLGQMKVVAISGAAPCSQIFSNIVYDSDWTESLTVLNRQRNGYRIIEVRGRKYAFGGERYTQMD